MTPSCWLGRAGILNSCHRLSKISLPMGGQGPGLCIYLDIIWFSLFLYGLLTRYVKLRVAHARGMRERFPRHRLQRKPLVNDPGMYHGTCVTHVSWCMSGSLTRGGGENVPGIPGACATRKFTYQARGPWHIRLDMYMILVCFVLLWYA